MGRAATTDSGTVQDDKSINGNTLSVRGTTYAKGIGTHANSTIVYNLNGQYASFISDVGLDDEENGLGTGSVDFQVIGDGKLLYDTGVLTSQSPIANINISVAGVQQLTLIAAAGVAGSTSYDDADWAGARLLAPSSTLPIPAAPTGLTATATSTTTVSLQWTDNATNETAYTVARSTDGITFTALSNAPQNATSYNDTGLSSNTTYYYQVSAINPAGGSTPALANATTPLAAPTTPSGATFVVVSPTQINLAWKDNANNESGYNIFRKTGSAGVFVLIAALPANSTSYNDTTVAPGNLYDYHIVAFNAAGNSDFVGLTATTSSVTFVSNLTWVSATVGYKTIQLDKNINGLPITLRGTVYAKGIGTHAASTIIYNLAGKYTNFISDVGIDDEVSGNGSVDFQVIGDGVVLFDSGIVTGASPVAHINVSVLNVKQLSLVATNGIPNNIDYDHADWAGA